MPGLLLTYTDVASFPGLLTPVFVACSTASDKCWGEKAMGMRLIRIHTQSNVEEYGCETQMHGKGLTESYNCVLLVAQTCTVVCT